jgi:thiol-disulfide isomerase/thioredoxin
MRMRGHSFPHMGIALLTIVAVGAGLVSAEDAPTLDLMPGIWVVLFGSRSECPSCEEAIAWIGDGREVFPEYSYAVSISRLSAQYTPSIPDGVTLHNDTSGQLRSKYGVTETPTVLVLAHGMPIRVRQWPFSRGSVLRMLAETALTADHIPRRFDLLGRPAPEFRAVDLDGEVVGRNDLDLPVVLGFLTLGCTSCLSSASMICTLGDVVNTVLVVLDADEERREPFASGLDPTVCSEVTVWLVDGKKFVPAYGITRSPSYVSINEEGTILRIHSGLATEAERPNLARKADL